MKEYLAIFDNKIRTRLREWNKATVRIRFDHWSHDVDMVSTDLVKGSSVSFRAFSWRFCLSGTRSYLQDKVKWVSLRFECNRVDERCR